MNVPVRPTPAEQLPVMIGRDAFHDDAVGASSAHDAS
jgi:hypothetical protein